MATALSLLGISTAIMMSCAERTEGNFLILLRRKLLANVCIAVLIFAGAKLYFTNFNPNEISTATLFATAILFPLYNLTDIWTSWLNGNRAFGYLAVGRVLRAGLACLAIAVFAMTPDPNLSHILWVYFGLISLLNLGYILSLFRKITNNIRDERTLSFSNHSSFALVFGSFLLLDVVLLGHFFSIEDVALYAVVLIFPELTKSIWSIINQLLAPHAFVNRPLSDFWTKFRAIIITLSIFWILLGLFGYYSLPFLIPLLFTDTYADASSYAQILWLGYCWVAPGAFFSNSILSRKQPIYAYVQQAGYPFLTLALYLAFIHMGIFGLVLARLLAVSSLSAFNTISFFYLMKKEKNVV